MEFEDESEDDGSVSIRAPREGCDKWIYGDIVAGIPDILFRGVSIKGWWLANYMGGKTVAEKDVVCSEILRLMIDGVVTPYAGKKFALADVQAAIGEATKSARGGKVFLS